MAREVKVFTYTVSGRGIFPADMLRYGRAWPAREEDAASMVNLTNFRTITLYGIDPPVTARWRSFGWRAELLDGDL